MKKVNDIAVIGGGAAGLFFAVTVKRLVPEASVTVFEANDRVGKKLAITGNGRCNITNRSASAEDYHGDGMLAERTLKGFDYEAQKAFFESLGVYFKTENDKVYPSSLQAASVVDALRFEAEESERKILICSPMPAKMSIIEAGRGEMPISSGAKLWEYRLFGASNFLRCLEWDVMEK